MDVKSLYTLVAIADCGSFGGAAKMLGVSLSSVSVQVSALERDTGLVLFDRSSRPPRLTEKGRDVLERAREIIAHWETLSDSLRQDTARGVLNIGAVHTTVAGVVAHALRTLQTERPDIDVRLETGLTHELEDKIERGLLDCAVISLSGAVRPGFSHIPIADEPLVIIAHADIAGSADEAILTQNPYVRFNRRASVGRLIEAELKRRCIAVHSPMEIDTLDAVVSLVEHGLGVSVVPDRAGGRSFPAAIRTVPFGAPAIIRKLGLVAAQDSPKAHLTALLAHALKSSHAALMAVNADA